MTRWRKEKPAAVSPKRWAQGVLGIVVLLGVTACGGTPPPVFHPGTTVTAVAGATSYSPISPLPTSTATPEPPLPIYTYKIINTFPHDRNAFTQGLVFADGIFYEGTGLYGHSSLRKVALATGAVTQRRNLTTNFFGEGITVLGNKLYQLTWKSHAGFVYNKDTFELLRTFSYPTEGWGITHDGKQLIMSDGSANLYFWDPETLERIGRVEVRDNDGPVVRLNELEYINGAVYANIWQTDHIVIINPQTGQVTGWIDLSGLLTPEDLAQPVDVLNGIAYDAAGNRLFVTGKWWPKIFEIELVEK